MSPSREGSSHRHDGDTSSDRPENIYEAPTTGNRDRAFVKELVLQAAEKIYQVSRPQEIHEPDATAIDFIPGQRAVVHYPTSRVGSPGDSPSFDCPIPPESIRVILYNTQKVFTRGLSRMDHDGEGSTDRILPDCEDCMPTLGLGDDQDKTAAKISTPTAIIDQDNFGTRTSVASVDNHPSGSSEQRRRPLPSSAGVDCTEGRPSRRRDGSAGSGTEFSSEEDDVWKRYSGGSSLDPLTIPQIWRRDLGGARIPIGVNLIFDTFTAVGRRDAMLWSNRLSGLGEEDRELMQGTTLNGLTTSFYTIPNLLRSSWQNCNNSLEVEMRFFSASSLSKEAENLEQISSPLSDELWNVLCSKNSAMALFDGKTELGARLLALDVLSAVSVCWLNFLNLMRRKSTSETHRDDTIDYAKQFQSLTADRESARDFSRSVRDLIQASDATIEAIKTTGELSNRKKAKLRDLVSSHQMVQQALQNTTKDIEAYIDTRITQAEQITREQQDASLKRLTLVASIFLPLTTASSLLSMTNRVRDIGIVWWDWAAIVVTTGFVVILGYRVTSSWHRLWHGRATGKVAEGGRQIWKTAKREVLAEQAKSEQLARSIRLGRSTGSLIPTSNRLIYHTSRYLFEAAAVASFMVGVFANVRTGAEALGYSVAGTMFAVVSAILIWKSAKFICLSGPRALGQFVRDHTTQDDKVDEVSREEKNEIPKEDGDCDKTNGAYQSDVLRSVEEDTDRLATSIRRYSSKLWFKILRWCIFTSIKWISRIPYWIFVFFFGKQVLQAVKLGVHDMAYTMTPVEFHWIRKQYKDMNRESQSKAVGDLEANEGNNRSRSRRDSSSSNGGEEQVSSGSRSPHVVRSKRRLDKGVRRTRRKMNEAEDGTKRAKTWTRREVKRTPTQNFLIKNNKMQRRAATLPADVETNPSTESDEQAARRTSGTSEQGPSTS